MKRTVYLAGLAAAVLAAWAIPRYQQDKRAALARWRSGSQMLNTACGRVEYAVAGEGQPVLALHGAGGGYEQGLLLGHLLSPQRYRIISVSRPGYRRTPLTAGSTPGEQAHLLRSVLDELGVSQAVVIAISAGGVAGLQFAQQYPDRCKSLILLSAAGPATLTTHAPAWILPLFKLMLSADGIIWALRKLNFSESQIHANLTPNPSPLGGEA
jgi:pimeloyl-ACP methyl ester carboxylesterase